METLAGAAWAVTAEVARREPEKTAPIKRCAKGDCMAGMSIGATEKVFPKGLRNKKRESSSMGMRVN
jgi:hypothetical protein